MILNNEKHLALYELQGVCFFNSILPYIQTHNQQF